MSKSQNDQLAHSLKPAKIVFPVLIGLAVIAWFLFAEIDIDTLSVLDFTWKTVFWIFVACLFMAGRDLGYMIRIRVLTDNELTWRQAFRVIMLWEFTSAITPTTVGGTAMAVVFLKKEKINIGRGTAVVLATSFLDELYFVIMLPLALMIIGHKALFIPSLQGTGMTFLNHLMLLTSIGYSVVLVWVIIVGYGLFFNPHAIRKLIIGFFKLPIIRRWQDSAVKAGNDIVKSSHELKKKGWLFWLKASVATFLSWTSRYCVVNAIIIAFFTINDHFLVFARQLSTRLMVMISPSPGGSGFAELILSRYISDTIPVDIAIAGSVALAIAIIWRVISYYPYLIIGALITPKWIGKNFIKPEIKSA